ncbi:hypothetical protein BD779DRAFT_1789595 [Infundibulicybe gibba]|nr:hypothetical protein BD779DRAFT_1789595 [Infundibulicybe gibba]
MTASQSDTPPPFDPVNVVDINSVTDGKIINVNLYSGRAEITRLYKVNARTGQNRFNITDLPNVLDRDSLRVEGRGSATIHDVTMSEAPVKGATSTSPALEALEIKKSRTKNALDRCNELLASLGSYLGTTHVKHIAANDLGSFIDNYTMTCERLDERVIELKQELEVIDADLKVAQDALGTPQENELLRQQVAISVFAELGETWRWSSFTVRRAISVRNANWEAAYDIRVETDSKEAPVTLIYKAMITQSTGESWNDIPLTLETATPTFGVEIPSLSNWNISVYRPTPPQRGHEEIIRWPTGAQLLRRRIHNVTIVELKLDAAMSWVAVPNRCQSTPQGVGSVYVTAVHLAVQCPLSRLHNPNHLSSSIKKTTHSGLYTKTINHAYSQRITIFNTKTISIKDLKIVDQIPVSEDSQITVKLTSPALTLPVPASENSKGSNNKVPPPVSVTSGVSAQWDGADEDDVDRESLGRNGRLNWVCEVPAQEKVNLVLSWEVTASANTPIIGL